MPQDYSDVNAVFPLKDYAITDVDTGTEVFTVAGDQTDRFAVADRFSVVNSTGNDAVWTVASTAYNVGTDDTDITVNEDITDATADGTILHDEISDFLEGTTAHDAAADRDLDIPEQFAGAHARRISNEIRELGQVLGQGLGFAVIDSGGLDLYFGSGTIIFGSGTPNEGDPGVVALTDDDDNYVEVDSSAVVSANVVGFTDGKYPLYIVSTASGAITDIQNKRSAIYISESAEMTHLMGGAQHIDDTLANVNAKISDATLDDSGDPRTPSAHASNHTDGTDNVSNFAGDGTIGLVPDPGSETGLYLEDNGIWSAPPAAIKEGSEDTDDTTTSATYVEATKVTKTLEAAVYLIIWSAEIGSGAADKPYGFRLQIDDATTVAEVQGRSGANNDFEPLSGMFVYTATAASHDFDFDFLSDGAETVTLRRKRISMMKVNAS